MITARMNNDKYIELSPGWPYEVVKYEDGKIRLKDIPRIYPASDFKIQKNGAGEALNGKETEKGMLMERIKDFLEVVGISMLFIVAGTAAFLIFAIGYYWFYLVFEPWFDKAFIPWLMNEIRIIFLHPENFCFTLGMLVFIGIPIVMGVVLLIGLIVRWVKKTLAEE